MCAMTWYVICAMMSSIHAGEEFMPARGLYVQVAVAAGCRQCRATLLLFLDTHWSCSLPLPEHVWFSEDVHNHN